MKITYENELRSRGKSISMSIRVSEEELDKLKQTERFESYVSHSEL